MHRISPLSFSRDSENDLATEAQGCQGQAQVGQQITHLFKVRHIQALDPDAAPAATHATVPQRFQQLLKTRIFPIKRENQLLQTIHPSQSP